MKYAYLRVSTTEQNLGRQEEWLKEVCPDMETSCVFMDKCSSRLQRRPEYERLKEALRSGDELYIKELDRLGRVKMDVKHELRWFQERGVKLRIFNIPTTLMDFDGNDWMLDMMNNILIEVYSSIADNELETNRRRQAEGYAAARARGQKFGSPVIPIPADFQKVWVTGRYTQREMAARYGVAIETIRKWLRKLNLPTACGKRGRRPGSRNEIR